MAVALGREWSDNTLVFPNTRGNIINLSNLEGVFRRIIKKSGIKHATVHSLRHTYATRCFEKDIPLKVISTQLGHKSVKVTSDIYVHLLKDKIEYEIDKLDDGT